MFNAALVIYSALLLQHQTKHDSGALPVEDFGLTKGSLQEGIHCLSMLFKGNRMTEKCVRYTSALAHWLNVIGNTIALPGESLEYRGTDVFRRSGERSYGNRCQ